MKYPILVFIAAAFAGFGAQADQPLSLEQACALALKNHPLVRAAQFDREAAAEGVTVAKSAYLPQISGDAVRAFASEGTRIASTGGLSNPTILDRGSLGLGLSQLITDFGRTSSLVAASKAELGAETARADQTQASVVLEATRAYFGVLRAEALVRVAQSTRDARATLLDKITGLHDAKLRSDLELSIARQGMADADLLLLKARTGVDDAYATLAQALGDRQTGRPLLTEDSNLPPPPGDKDVMISFAFDHNPELRSLRAEVDAARQRANAEKRALYPTISALGYAGVSPERDPAGILRPHYATGGVVLDVPIFTGGRLSGRARQAALHADSLAERLEDQRNVLSRDLEIAYGNTQTAFQNIQVTDQLQRNAETTLDLTRNLYEIGKSSIVDLNQAELAATQAEIIHTEAIFGYRVQRAFIAYLAGDLVGGGS